MEFIKLKSEVLTEQKKTGDAIIKVSQSVFQTGPTSEWEKFDKDTRKWLFDNGYIYTGTPDGKIPPEIEIVPVYDTPTKMHVRVPWHGDLENPPPVVDERPYNGIFPVLLARYFMRKCR
jgi:hypothetical protein